MERMRDCLKSNTMNERKKGKHPDLMREILRQGLMWVQGTTKIIVSFSGDLWLRMCVCACECVEDIRRQKNSHGMRVLWTVKWIWARCCLLCSINFICAPNILLKSKAMKWAMSLWKCVRFQWTCSQQFAEKSKQYFSLYPFDGSDSAKRSSGILECSPFNRYTNARSRVIWINNLKWCLFTE